MASSVTVVGAGVVGVALARGMAEAGRVVRIAVRDPDQDKHEALRETYQLCALGDELPEDHSGENAVVVLAVPAPALNEIVGQLRLQARSVVIDATNAVGTPVPDGFASVGEYVQSLVPDGVAVVKAFNTIGAEHLANGHREDGSTFLPIAGDDAGRGVVASLAAEMGFDVADLGGPEMMAMVEDHARLWIHLALRRGWGRQFVFSVAGTKGA